jgi:hypothetical protein
MEFSPLALQSVAVKIAYPLHTQCICEFLSWGLDVDIFKVLIYIRYVIAQSV